MHWMTLALMLAASPQADDDIATLTHMKEVLWPQAYRTGNTRLLEQILHPTFQMVDSEGVWSDRASELAGLGDYDWPHDKFEYVIKRLEFYNDAAIIAGEGSASGVGDNGPYSLRYQSTNVLIRTDGRWQAVASHVSGVELTEGALQ